MTPPLVSVVVPAYDATAYLEETLESILAQDHDPLEVVVVDDGSNDGTAALAEAVAARDPRVRLVRHGANRGVAAAVNTGIAQARGELVAPCGADDLMMPGNLATKAAVFERHPSVGFVFGNAEAIDDTGKPLRVLDPAGSSRLMPAAELFRSLLYRNPIVASSVVIRSECLRVVGAYDESLRHAEDWDMWLRIAWRFDGFYTAAPLVRHRLHPRSLRVENASADLDLAAMERLVRKAFAQYDLGRLGYDFDEVYWSNYFRMLHSKVGTASPRRVLRMYLHGLRRYRRRGIRRADLVLLGKTAARGLVPARAFHRLQRQWRRVGRGRIGA